MAFGEPIRAQPKPVKRPKKPRRFIARNVRPKVKRATTRRSKRIRDLVYLAWMIRTQPCAARGVGACGGGWVTEADHVGRRPLGRKCSDRETIPLCSAHHRDRHDGNLLPGWSKARLRAWLDEQVRIHQERYAKEPTP